MRLRAAFTALAATTVLAGTPALAHGHGWGGQMGGWQQPYPMVQPQWAEPEQPPQDREGWLRECRRRLGDNGIGGAVIGGALGGVAGNVIAGPGNRAVGTIAGAVAGAVAGAAIDKGEDKAATRDRCKAMLEGGPAYAGGAGYAAPGYMMVPVMMVPVQGPPQPNRECKETVVTEEFVTYVPRRAARHIPRRAPDKRIPQ